jgi:hypothetical protein
MAIAPFVLYIIVKILYNKLINAMKDEILNRFDKTTDELIGLLTPLTQEQLNKVPFENSWTAGQVGDHLCKSYDATGVLNGNIKATDRVPDEKAGRGKQAVFRFHYKNAIAKRNPSNK